MTLTSDLGGHVTNEVLDPTNRGVSNLRFLLWCPEVPKLGFLKFSRAPTHPLGVGQKKKYAHANLGNPPQ